MLRVQAAEPLAGVDAPFMEIVNNAGAERIKGVWHRNASLVVLDGLIIAYRPGRNGATRGSKIS